MGKYNFGVARNRDSVLLVFKYSNFYGIYKCRIAAWSNIFVLISSPMVDLGSLVLLMSIFGAKIAFVYVILGLAIAVIGGTLIEKMHMETYVEEFIRNASHVESDFDYHKARTDYECKRTSAMDIS